MDWAVLQNDLPTLLKELLGLPCEWGDQPRTYLADSRAFVDLLEPESIGVDDRTLSNVTVGGEPHVVETVTGAREAVVQVTVHSLSQEMAKSARVYLERLRTRLHFSTSVALLSALGLALVSIGPVIEIDPIEDMRAVSSSVLEVRCAYVHSESDEPAPFIETARVYSDKARNAAGAELPAVLQMDETGPEV